MKLPERYKERARDFIIIMIIILGLMAGACLIAGWMSEDIEAKSIAISNELTDSQIAERDYGAMEKEGSK